MKSFVELVQEIKKAFDKDDNSVLHNINSNIEKTSTAEYSHNVGTQLIYNKTLYDVISAISVNDTLEVGVNIIKSPSITNQLGNKVPTYSNTPAAWDTTPTASSTKPVTSDGIYRALSSVTVADMTGATSSTDGAHGLVPAPLIADEKKFLRGDGTWAKDYVELHATLAAGATQVTFTSPYITADCSVSIQTKKAGLNWTAVDDSTAGTLIYTYPAQTSPVDVRLIIRG